MVVQEREAENSFSRYIAEIRAAWGDGKDSSLPFTVAGLMERVARYSALTPLASGTTSTSLAETVACDLHVPTKRGRKLVV